MLQLDAAALAARLDRRSLIEALDAAFRKPCSVPTRQQYQLEPAQPGGSGGTLLVMPAWRTGDALGIKLVTVFPDNALRGLPAVSASYLLLDAATGQPRAILDGAELTLRRTGAASALASRALSSPDAARLTMVGTGRLAPHLIESHAAVRPIREVRIWGRRADRARALAASLASTELSVEGTDDLEAAVRWADIISCATLSRQPLVRGAWLKAGQHVDLVGAFTPEMREADDETIARAELCVDTRAGALEESGEIIGAIARGVIDRNGIGAELSELASGRFKRSRPEAITVFKSVGCALEDLAAAQLALAQCNPASLVR
ncbi:MAG TPA: ornithine cyclodeaminase family protein [Steroidobacteraceae bacterium]|jgi:ornithine cyclodeaminase|nr:ornithine cyclodeaminase family protein [Steroidobacteraceae bacterium]